MVSSLADNGRVRRRGFIALLTVTVATIVLFLVSRGKWSDPIIDSGREWIVPDALSRGELLYRDVVYWFGPFTPYWHALFFRLAGSSFGTLVLAGIVSSAAILACLRLALLRITDARQANAWTAVAIPWLVFMPDAGGAILGMGFRMWHAAGFGLLALTLLILRPGSAALDFGAGLAAGAAGLCRTEWGVAVLVAALVGVGLRSPKPTSSWLRLPGWWPASRSLLAADSGSLRGLRDLPRCSGMLRFSCSTSPRRRAPTWRRPVRASGRPASCRCSTAPPPGWAC